MKKKTQDFCQTLGNAGKLDWFHTILIIVDKCKFILQKSENMKFHRFFNFK